MLDSAKIFFCCGLMPHEQSLLEYLRTGRNLNNNRDTYKPYLDELNKLNLEKKFWAGYFYGLTEITEITDVIAKAAIPVLEELENEKNTKVDSLSQSDVTQTLAQNISSNVSYVVDEAYKVAANATNVISNIAANVTDGFSSAANNLSSNISELIWGGGKKEDDKKDTVEDTNDNEIDLTKPIDPKKLGLAEMDLDIYKPKEESREP